LFRELGILGYHVLSTRHICEVTKFIEQTVHVKCGNEKATFKILVKIIGERQSVSYPRVEHEHVVEVQREIQRRFGWEMPLRELVSEVESAAHGNRAEVTIELNSSRPDQTR
jgi:hypothetical protein